jgi:uncharacterized protein (DUF1800 family)
LANREPQEISSAIMDLIRMTTPARWPCVGLAPWLFTAFLCCPAAHCAGLDRNTNGLNDIWEMFYGAGALSPNGDADGDGFTNAQESAAGTDPRNAASVPRLGVSRPPEGLVRFDWGSVAGKRYRLLSRTNAAVGVWNTNGTFLADGPSLGTNLPASFFARFFRLAIDDVDSDGDGLLDAEERLLSFNPFSNHTDRQDTTDFQRVTNGLAASSVVSVSALDPVMSERWSDGGLVAVRRKGGLAPLAVNLSFTGSATRKVDYTTSLASNTILIPAGTREVWVELYPLADALDAEPSETITVMVQPGTGYTVGASNAAMLTLDNETPTSGPSAKAAARFLIQAAFGPDADSPADADSIPEKVEEAMTLGFEGWINDQFTRPVGYLQPWVDWAEPQANALEFYGNLKEYSWWNRAMGVPKLRPDATTNQPPDPLRQRVAFALSEIFVVSDRLEQLGVEERGMANYYDLLLKHAFGNYRDLLYDVARHPCMGIFLSHLGNRKADLVNRVYPDENFAREIMQLFSIGLWELNPDGTRQLDAQGQPIPTYDNRDITELARVFTGLSFGNNTDFALYPREFTVPMKMWDAYHDCDAKTLLRGVQLPTRAPSPGNTGTAGLADVWAAVTNLFEHPNVGPFIGRQLIQRFVTSNPSPGYVGRVAAAFANNGAGVRGDLKAVIKAVLLDPEARDPQMMNSPTWGKLREPFLRCVNLARAFNAASASGWYLLDAFDLDHLQEPQRAPSVFNFFLPTHSPPGPITQLGLVAPEFQIINASSAITGPNYFWNAIANDLHRWGAGNANYAVRLNLTNELALIVPANLISQDVPNVAAYDPDALLQRLDLALTGGTLSPPQFQIIREAMERVNAPTWHWHRERLRLGIYLIATSPDFNVLR